MTTAVVVLLGVMALASLTQAVFLIVLAVEGRRLAQRVDTFQSRIGGEMRPILGEITRATENLAAASAATVGQARRIDVVMTEVTSRLSDTQGLFRNLIIPTVIRLVSVTAAVRAVRRGLAMYRRVRR
jgi:predicted PurR-regulated permease PerM